jgi:undecaprenyl-diphosphatase
MVSFEFLNRWDAPISIFIQRVLSSPQLDGFFLTITDLHKLVWFQFGVVFPLIVWWLWKEKNRGLYKLLSLISILALIDGFCGQIVKKIFARPRPFAEFAEIVQKSPASGFSFVSNHAANMVGFAVFFSVFYPRSKFIWWAFALLVGFSRIYNGVHYVSDILIGGMIGAFLSLILSRWSFRKIEAEKK